MKLKIASIVVICIAVWLGAYSVIVEQEHAEDERAYMMDKINEYNRRLKELERGVEKYNKHIDMLKDRFDTWDISEAEITAYAPLDPSAKEGICYSGNPNITASGAQVVPGVTVAAGPSIPFGTRVWIEGFGWRTVQDRGGKISDRHIDIAVSSRAEAFSIGRKRVKVIWEIDANVK